MTKPTTEQIANTSTVTGAVLTDALETLKVASDADTVVAAVAAHLLAGAGITVSYSGITGNITLTSTAVIPDGDKGDITSSASGATWTIDAGAVTLAKMANLAANSIMGNNTGSPATPIALTAAQVKTLLAIATGDVSGFNEAVDDRVAALLVAGSNITLTYNDAANTLTVAATVTPQLMHVRDEKTANTGAASLTANVWNVRDLNTVVVNTVSGASLSANRVTLPAGTYLYSAIAPTYSGSNSYAHRLKLVNTTGPADLALGTVQHTSLGGSAQMQGRLVLAGSTTIELQHFIPNGVTVTGGYQLNAGTEYYADLLFQKIA